MTLPLSTCGCSALRLPGEARTEQPQAGWEWSGRSSPPSRELARGIAFDLVEPIIDIVRKTNEAEVAVVLKEDDDGSTARVDALKGRR